ncbi:ankyrin repeat domain-containing protein [Fusarium pseudocircinatum]|uniref:Ankyrin repeat domain-containing protein n=1 Tax=Fusarium pseudocircinatum TaxID=56676 RepID=A0A8H5PG62_9HYPO|nr:ankyrin repeat domain-containing protein [Fusarium pseudocircinatum]
MKLEICPWEEAILLAAASGRIQDLQEELSEAKNIETLDVEHSYTPLHWAVLGGHEAAVELLLAHSADVNASHATHGLTPLLNAVINGHKSIAERLIVAGADVDTPDVLGDTPLIIAARGKDPAIAKLLLEAGANVNNRDWRYGKTALSLAAEEGWEDLTDLLIQYEAVATLADDNGCTALYGALKYGHASIARKLAEKESRERSGDAELILSAMAAHLEPEEQESYKSLGPTQQLLKACNDQNYDIITSILDKHGDFNVDTRDERGMTPLAYVAGEDKVEIARLLLDRGANVNAASATSWTPLMSAAERGREEMGFYLLQRGASPHAKDGEGYTPLHLAASAGCVRLVERLLDAGADPNAENRFYNLTPISMAAECSHLGVVELLLTRGVSPNHDNRTLLCALQNLDGHEDICHNTYIVFKKLVDYGANVFMDGWTDERPLVIATKLGLKKIVALFLEADFTSAEIRQDHIEEAVCTAAEEGERTILAMLMEHYACRENDPKLESPWVWAEEYDFGWSKKLLRPYFNPDSQDSDDSESSWDDSSEISQS